VLQHFLEQKSIKKKLQNELIFAWHSFSQKSLFVTMLRNIAFNSSKKRNIAF
jgi:hypothetical protein